LTYLLLAAFLLEEANAMPFITTEICY